MPDSDYAPRLRRLPLATVLGREVRVAEGVRARFFGLAHLDAGSAGRGLLIPRCRSVHTFGMRFPLDLYFLDEEGVLVSFAPSVQPRRVVAHRGADAVLEVPAGVDFE